MKIKTLLVLGSALVFSACSSSTALKDIKTINYSDRVLNENYKGNYVRDYNLEFKGFDMDRADINDMLRKKHRDCNSLGDYETCNLLAKYYLNKGNKRAAYKYFTKGCNDKNPYACGVKQYIKAGGR